jgi:hypothetical protein
MMSLIEGASPPITHCCFETIGVERGVVNWLVVVAVIESNHKPMRVVRVSTERIGLTSLTRKSNPKERMTSNALYPWCRVVVAGT